MSEKKELYGISYDYWDESGDCRSYYTSREEMGLTLEECYDLISDLMKENLAQYDGYRKTFREFEYSKNYALYKLVDEHPENIKEVQELFAAKKEKLERNNEIFIEKQKLEEQEKLEARNKAIEKERIYQDYLDGKLKKVE